MNISPHGVNTIKMVTNRELSSMNLNKNKRI